MRRHIAALILALGVAMLSAPGLASAQDGGAQARVEGAASTLEGVSSMRYTGQTSVTPDATGTPIKVFGGNGEFQAPDRGRMTIEQPLVSQVNHTVTIGQAAWMLSTDGANWAPLPSAAAPPAPRTIADELRQVAKYIVSPTVNDGETQTVISGDVDLARAVSEESPIAAIMGAGFTGDTDQGSLINASRVVIIIDRGTGLPISLDTTLGMTPAVPPEGIPPGPLTITTTLALSDFNSADVVINEPGR